MPGESLKMLLRGCPKLKKLFLAAIRGLTDRDLDNIATYCPHLEQLDLMGIMTISTEMCYKILQKCTKLKLFDLSFCDQIDDFQVSNFNFFFMFLLNISLNSRLSYGEKFMIQALNEVMWLVIFFSNLINTMCKKI